MKIDELYDVMIIGAGPVGNFLSASLSKKGMKVINLEEHPEIGYPVHCTGIVGDTLMNEFNIPDTIKIKELKAFKIVDPNGYSVDCSSGIKANIIDRAEFDRHLADLSARQGTEYWLSAKVENVEQDEEKATAVIDRKGETIRIQSKICVFATGSMSELPFRSGMDRPRFYLSSVQVDAQVKDLEGAELHIGRNVAYGSFAYAVSVNGEKSKIGVILERNAENGFVNLLKSPGLVNRLLYMDKKKEFRRIPMGIPKNTVNGRLITVGDAAGQIKTTTGGGILFGLICSRMLSETIHNSRKGRGFSIELLKKYDRSWKKIFVKEINIGMLLRKSLEALSDEELVKICRIIDEKKIFMKNGIHFDFHQRFLLEMLKVPELRRIILRIAGRNLKNSLL